MPTLFVTLLLAQIAGDSPRPTTDQIEQAHRLLNGDWEIVSFVDDGETIGGGIVRAKMAKDGRLTVSDRTFRITNPETNETRVSPFRLNPLTTPRRIEVTTRDDRTVSGIYRFEGDELLVCLESFPDTGYPGTFDAPSGSNRTLIRLRMMKPAATATPPAAPAEIRPEIFRPTTPAVTPDDHAARATFTSSRKPTEAELTRVRQLFSGNWQIESIVDDGENLGAELIRRRFAEDGRIRFGTRAFAIVNPKTEERKVNSYRVDPTKTPSEIDVTTQFDSVLKGIYAFDGDRLNVCLAKNEDDARPDGFDAPGGSGRLLVKMRLAKDDVDTTTAATPRPQPEPKPQPQPPPDDEARKLEAKVRRLITGSWTMSDTKGTLTTVFQPDGLFVATRTWARGSRRLFGPASDSSNGSWSYRDGVLRAWVSSTTDPRIAGHQINSRVQSIGDDTMVVTDVYGSVKTFRRLR